MNTERTNVGWSFSIAWVLASIVGFCMGSLIVMSVSYALLAGMGITDEFGVAHILMFGTMLGTTSGFLQWVVLREKVAQAGWWVLASAMGSAIAGGTLGTIGIGESNEDYVRAGILFTVLFGAAGGIMQALVLKRAQIARVGLWVLASILGSLVGAIGIPISSSIGATGNYGLSTMVFGLLLGAGLGAIPGVVLVWLLRQSPSSKIEGLAPAH